MGKMVSASEFKAKCLKLIDEMQKDGQPVTITKRGRVVAEIRPAGTEEPAKPLFGCMRGTGKIVGDIISPIDPDWETKWDAKWDERLRDDRR